MILQLGDEHAELVGNLTCLLAKHRKSDTIDRKDVQLAYELTEPRAIPGFSSDLIRMDQARSTKRAGAPIAPNRANKLKLVAEAKNAWRKEKIATKDKESEDKRQKLDLEGDEDEEEEGQEDATKQALLSLVPIATTHSAPKVDGPMSGPPPAPMGITA